MELNQILPGERERGGEEKMKGEGGEGLSLD